MPLVVFCGYPSSGKSTWAKKLSNFLTDVHKKEVHIIREDENFRGEKNDILDDSRKEKELRAKIKSHAQRILTNENVVIIDALNYIKGYRYELYCMSKAIPTRQITVQCEISENQAWEWNLNKLENDQYKREVFDHLIQRFEPPDPQNRWDNPFFSVLPNEELGLDGVFNALFNKPLPKQNLSTQIRPVSESNSLATIEKITSDIIQKIVEEIKINKTKNKGGEVEEEEEEEEETLEIKVPYSDTNIVLSNSDILPNVAQLNKLKRQFISLTCQKAKASKHKEEIGNVFVQYLNTQLKME